jgi:hypothetical protein
LSLHTYYETRVICTRISTRHRSHALADAGNAFKLPPPN